MGLHEVEQAIRRDAEAAAERKLELAREEAARIVAAGQAQTQTERSRFDAQTHDLLAAVERREIGQASAHGKSLVLAAQRRTLTETFARAMTMLSELTPKERATLITALTERARRELPDIARIKCNPQDVRTILAAVPNTEVLGDEHIAGGLIAEDEAGEVRSELTYDTLLAAVRERELPAIARMLFPDRAPATVERTR